MALTVAQVIRIRSNFTVGLEGKIPTEDLEALETMASPRVTKIIGNRTFSADELTELTALVILDMLQNKSGRGTVYEESVTDSTVKSKKPATSSAWMDEVMRKIAEYDSSSHNTTTYTHGARRIDVHMDDIIDGYYVRHHRSL